MHLRVCGYGVGVGVGVYVHVLAAAAAALDPGVEQATRPPLAQIRPQPTAIRASLRGQPHQRSALHGVFRFRKQLSHSH